jgi:hypothetical protein
LGKLIADVDPVLEDYIEAAASASRQAELRANFVKLRAGLTHDTAQNGD